MVAPDCKRQGNWKYVCSKRSNATMMTKKKSISPYYTVTWGMKMSFNPTSA